MSLAATVGRVSELCNCRWANERTVHGACVPVTSRAPAPLYPHHVPLDVMKRAPRTVRTSSAFLKMADGLCTGDAARRNAIEEHQGVKEKQNRRREDKAKECGRKNGFLVGSVSDDKLCGDDDGLCPKHHDEEGFLVVEMPAEDDCRKKRCVDRYDSSESSDRYVWVC